MDKTLRKLFLTLSVFTFCFFFIGCEAESTEADATEMTYMENR